ncbi:Glucan endo-1,3-beta-D-glucosidase [Platanthera zijinensis]|uniref:Glucan endo-1,3-beta-D-glucosidase n=1 Tax=Platanthera zijinensis TaxID=2320716 RepID=A0AAP0GCW8_9ASPA
MAAVRGGDSLTLPGLTTSIRVIGLFRLLAPQVTQPACPLLAANRKSAPAEKMSVRRVRRNRQPYLSQSAEVVKVVRVDQARSAASNLQSAQVVKGCGLSFSVSSSSLCSLRSLRFPVLPAASFPHCTLYCSYRSTQVEEEQKRYLHSWIDIANSLALASSSSSSNDESSSETSQITSRDVNSSSSNEMMWLPSDVSSTGSEAIWSTQVEEEQKRYLHSWIDIAVPTRKEQANPDVHRVRARWTAGLFRLLAPQVTQPACPLLAANRKSAPAEKRSSRVVDLVFSALGRQLGQHLQLQFSSPLQLLLLSFWYLFPQPPASPIVPSTALIAKVGVLACESTDPLKTWCVAKPSTKEEDLQNNIQFACSKIDCSLIQRGGPCFDPQTSISHASVVMNLYFQSAGRHSWNCYFGGSSLIALTDPSYGACSYGKCDETFSDGARVVGPAARRIRGSLVVRNLQNASHTVERGSPLKAHGRNSPSRSQPPASSSRSLESESSTADDINDHLLASSSMPPAKPLVNAEPDTPSKLQLGLLAQGGHRQHRGGGHGRRRKERTGRSVDLLNGEEDGARKMSETGAARRRGRRGAASAKLGRWSASAWKLGRSLAGSEVALVNC